VIAQFKREQGLEGFKVLLERHGYTPTGHDPTAQAFIYLSPKSTSGNPGVKLLYGECADGIVFSWHGNDFLPSERGLDYFEAFAILEHAGDKSAAFKAAKQHLGLWQDSPTARAATSAAVSTSEPPNTPTEPNEPPNAGGFEARRLTEWSNALRLQQFFGDTVAYTPGLGWFVYSETLGIFEHDDGGHRIRRRATEALQQQLRLELADFVVQSAAASGNARAEFDAIIKSWQKWLKTSASKRCVEASLGFLQDLTIIDPTEWDSNPWLLVLANGALNLKTLELQPHSAKHKSTKRSPVRFDANAVHPALESMLELLRRDDREVTLQRALGSCLTGFAPNEKLFYLVGTGGTGKSTLMESVSTLLGDYAVTVDPTMLLEQRNGGNTGARPDLLRLRGARLAVAGELPKHGKLDSAQVKALTRRDTISARSLYSGVFVDFEPVFKLFVHSNYDVKTEWDDTGIQRRLLRIPFNAKPETPDPQLKDTLKNDPIAQSALLLWLLVGLQEWLQHGYDLAESEVIQQAIRDYHRENNPFYEFAEDCLKFTNDLSKQAPAKDLRGAYVQWCDGIGVRPRSSNELGRWLASQGCERQQVKIQGTNTRVWAGVVIKGAFG
jgi:P4 family phage/plasmid primase-like protien